jgi:PAS domain S-box-containing protein
MGAQTFTEADSSPFGQNESSARAHGHNVQFYEKDGALLDELGRFFGAAILAGDSALVIATKSHLDELKGRLSKRGLDLVLIAQQRRFVCLDASETLSEIMVDGWPNPARFTHVMGSILSELSSAAQGQVPRVAAFGEMVAVLWADGNADAAIQLEHLWNDLARTHTFDLLCAYPMHCFSRMSDVFQLQQVCSAHAQLIPAESFTVLMNEEDRLRSVIFMQQKAEALETEVLERKKAQQALQNREAELRDFLENAVIGMHWVAADGTVLWANRAEMDLLGYTREEYIGHHISEFHADKAAIEDILQRLGQYEVLHGYEASLRCKDGSIRYVRIDSNVFVQDGVFIHTRCFTLDITDKRKAEEGCLRLAAIVESSEDGIASKDLNGIVTSWNAGAERIFGYKAHEMVGRSIMLIIPEEFHGDEEHILSKVRAGERIEHFETVRMTKAGKHIHVSLTVSPVKDERGKVIGVAKIVRDITRQKEIDAALRTTERLASVGRLAATVAHEINNPLEAVVNFIYLAKQNPDVPETVRHYLTCADKELGRVAHIAQQTLGFYRDTSSPVWLTLWDVIEDVLAIYDRKFTYKRLELKKKVPPDLKIHTLQGELKQVLSNLIGNAIDASTDNSKIYIRACAAKHHMSARPGIRITVADEGSGISSESKEKLFTPFFTTKKEVGTGLGLWITKDLIEKRGGKIRFRSRTNPKSGTVVNIFLPLESTDTSADSKI